MLRHVGNISLWDPWPNIAESTVPTVGYHVEIGSVGAMKWFDYNTDIFMSGYVTNNLGSLPVPQL